MSAHPSGGLRVYLFGAPKFVLGGVPITLKAPPRTVPLFASLLLDEPLARHGRERLARGLWPDLEPGEARTNLRRHLSYLRKALEGIGIAAPGLGELEIGTDVVAWADVRAFVTLASGAGAQAAEAIALYRGRLLAPYENEEWVEPYRARFARDYIALVLRLMEENWQRGDAAEALVHAERALMVEPLAEELVAAALRLSIETDAGSTGLALFDRFASRLRSAYDEEPKGETLALVDRLRKRSTPVALPVPVDSFVGRDDAVAALAKELQVRRCVSLYGPPGIGKTRLAAALAWAEAARFLDGAYWIDVGRLEDGSTLEAQTLRSLASRGGASDARLADRVTGRSLLVVFDGCEHVVAAVREFVSTLLRASAGVRAIVTSTRRIEIEGSLEWTVEPLRSGDAVTLFEERAAAAAPRTRFDRAAVASLCSALDGIPLAIELAARRTRSVPLASIARDATESAGAALEGALARSAALLSPQGRTMFERLGVLRGEFTCASAAGLCDVTEARATELLEELLAAHLVVVASLDDAVRYDMLSVVRAYAWRSIDATERRAHVLRHADLFGRRVVQFDEALRGAFAFESYRLVENDYADISYALDVTLADPQRIEIGARMCLALSRFWYDRGFLADGIRYTTLAIERLPHSDAYRLLVAELAWVLAWLRRNGPDLQRSYRECKASLDLMVAADGPPRRIAFGHVLVANAARAIGNYDEARTEARAGLRIFEELGERYLVGYAQLLCGVTELSAGEVEAARACLLESFRAYEATGAKADAALALANLGECAYADGEIDLADTIASDAVERCIQVGNRYFLAYANHGHARVFVARGRWDAGIRCLLGVTRSAQEFGDPELVALCAELAAEVLRFAKRYATAAMLLGAADAERERAGATRPLIYRSDYDRQREALVGKLGAEAAEHARSIGAAFASRDLCGRIEIALRDAVRLLTPRERSRAGLYLASTH